MDGTSLGNLFHQLARRMRSEDALSDLTWAVMQCVPAVRHSICAFHGASIPRDAPLVSVREYTLGPGCRIDFAFISENPVLYLENKLWDRDYHFVQYAAAIAGDEHVVRGLISNHRLSAADLHIAAQHGWHVKSWEDLVKHLAGQEFGSAGDLVKGYLKYVSEVCSMAHIAEIRLDRSVLRALRDLNALVARIVEKVGNRIQCRLYNQGGPRAFGPAWSGVYYELGNPRLGKLAYPFFGIDFSEDVRICVALDTDWNSDLVRHLVGTLPEHGATKDPRFVPRRYDDGFSFCLPDADYLRFSNLGPEDQENLLMEFFIYVNQEYLIRR